MMVPSVTKAACRPASVSTEVLGRTPSSVVTTKGSPLRCLTLTGAISPSNIPLLRRPAAARWCDCGGHFVLGRAVDAQGEVLGLGGQAHGLAVEGIGQAVMGGDVQCLDGAVGPPLPGTGQQVRRPAHRFLAAGHHHGGVAAADHAGGVDHGSQAGEAHLVDGHGRDVPADAGADGSFAAPGFWPAPACRTWPMITASTSAASMPLAANSSPDGVGAEVHGGEAGQLPVEAALRGPRCCEDDNVAVVRRVAHDHHFQFGSGVSHQGYREPGHPTIQTPEHQCAFLRPGCCRVPPSRREMLRSRWGEVPICPACTTTGACIGWWARLSRGTPGPGP